MSESLNAIEQNKPLVVTTGRYFASRFMRSAFDLFLTLIVFLIFNCILSEFVRLMFSYVHLQNALHSYISYLFVGPICFSTCVFFVKWWSSKKDWAYYGLNVVTRDGRPVSVMRAGLRAAACGFTWYLIPLHLALIAAGSRRCLHDLMTGTYMLMDGEDLNKSFYPPTPRWIGAVLVAVSVPLTVYVVDAGPAIKNFERSAVGALLDTESEQYFHYLEWRYSEQFPRVLYGLRRKEERFWPNVQRAVGLGPVCMGEDGDNIYGQREEGKQLLPVFQQMTDLAKKYAGPQAESTTKYMYETAYLAMLARNSELVDRYLTEFLSQPPEVAGQALDSIYIENSKALYSRLMAARLYYKMQMYDKAIVLAAKEKAEGRLMLDKTRFEQSTRLLIDCYRAKLHSWESLAESPEIIRKETEDLEVGL